MSQPGEKSKRPSDNPFLQQKMKMWQPIMTPTKVVLLFLTLGIAFVPTGVSIIKASNNIFESSVVYDEKGSTNSCAISSENAGKSCTIQFVLDQVVHGDLFVYYELGNFYQNNRKYASSLNYNQLAGSTSETDANLELSCDPMTKNGSLTLSPCGLIANSYFNDVFTCTSHSLDEGNIAWASDKDLFKQPDGFKYSQIQNTSSDTCATYGLNSDCKKYCSGGVCYYYYYPEDSTTQYLYESYPEQISPIVGVTDQHFKVWMRTAALPNFRKLYGRIPGGFAKGTTITFTVNANFEVQSFDGSKTFVITTHGEFGGRNAYLGVAYVVVGALCLFFGALFTLKQVLFPRMLGDPNLLPWA